MFDILLIDDDTEVLGQQILGAFPSPEYRVEIAARGDAGIERVRERTPDVVLLDVRLPDASGLEVFEAIREQDARIPVIFITTAKNADTAIEAMKLGAFDYLYKPLDVQQLRVAIARASEVVRLREPVLFEVPNETSAGAMLGASQAMLDVFKAIGRVAAQDVTVLVTGESGAGKELVARAICQHSTRARAPFLALNCAAIPEHLLESELFGYERGAFTGADRRKIGKFEQCNGGTLLLDEIGDMPSALQAKILRVLQERAFERIGGTETIHTDVRVIAATHRDLKTHAAFRQDLYYRLGVFTIHLPPLRERAEDIPPLVNHFTRVFSAQLGRHITHVAPDALAALVSYSWPGNIRELQSVIRHALLHASGTVLLRAFLPSLTAAAAVAVPGTPGFDIEGFIRTRLAPGTNDLFGAAHREVDRLLIAHTLRFTHGNHRDAAAVLGISRQTLRMRMRGLGLHVEAQIDMDDAREDRDCPPGSRSGHVPAAPAP